MLKSALRKEAVIQRRLLSPETFNELNAGLLEQFTLLDLSAVKVIHTFIPIREKREPDTWMIIRWLQQHHPHIRIVLPRADFDTLEMTNHDLIGEEQLVVSDFNIPEPDGSKVYTGPIDLIILPLLAFDRLGNRVGYGKGFYDRFLTQHYIPMRIGLSLFPPVPLISDADSKDVRMNFCLTPGSTYRF